MLSKEDFSRLARLLNNLYLCTGVKFALMDGQGREVYTSSYRAPFCSLIISEQAGAERCAACDRHAVEEAGQTRAHRRYLCHAGLYESVMPVMENGQVAATILFGQMLNDAPRDEQWQRVSTRCAWYPDRDGLREAFLKLRRISGEQMDACMEIVTACVSEVRLHGLYAMDNRDDALRLRMYIDAHYAEPLDTDALAGALHVGKTKLYEICQRRFRMTPMQMLAKARIDAAKELLVGTHESVKAISQVVGFPDPNYFTKVFKKTVGASPSAFRAAEGSE